MANETKKEERAKTYTERLEICESVLVEAAGTINSLVQTINLLSSSISVLKSKVDSLQENNMIQGSVLQGMSKILEGGQKFSQELLGQTISDIQVEKLQSIIDEKVHTGIWVESDSVANDDDIVVYSAEPVTALAYNEMGKFDDEVKKSLMGAKPGDEIPYSVNEEQYTIKVVNVYSHLVGDGGEGSPTSANPNGINMLNEALKA